MVGSWVSLVHTGDVSTTMTASLPFDTNALDAPLPERVHLAWQLITKHPDAASNLRTTTPGTRTRAHTLWQQDQGHVLSTLR